jgi:RNA polymerase sigma-70 factor (ECF subfamily)
MATTLLHADVLNLAARQQVSVATELDDIDTLARNYRPRLLRFVMASVRDEDLADTIVQDALLKAYRNRAGFRGDCSLNTWLTGIAVNLIRDHARTQKFKFWKKASANAVEADEMANHLRSSGSSPEGMLLAREQALQVHQAMEELSNNQRTVFLLRFIEEMELAEISEAMDMPVNTVKTHLHRAVKAVRAKVGGQRV